MQFPACRHPSGKQGKFHQHGNEGGNFHGCVPAVDIALRVGFSDADLLAVSDCPFEAVAMFHPCQDHVSGRIQHALDRIQACGRQRLAK